MCMLLHALDAESFTFEAKRYDEDVIFECALSRFHTLFVLMDGSNLSRYEMALIFADFSQSSL